MKLFEIKHWCEILKEDFAHNLCYINFRNPPGRNRVGFPKQRTVKCLGPSCATASFSTEP